MKQMTQNLRWLVTLLAMIVSVGAWAEEETITLTHSTFGLTRSYSTKTVSYSGFDFTVDQGYKGDGDVIQMNSSRGNGILYNTKPITGLKSITVNVSKGDNTYTITTGTEINPTGNSQTETGTKTFEASQNSTYFQLKVSGACYFSSIVITYDNNTSTEPSTGAAFTRYSGALTEGDYIIYYNRKAMNTTVSSKRLQCETVTNPNDIITTDDATIIWHIAPSDDYWTIYNVNEGKFAASTGRKNEAQLLTDETDEKILWTVSSATENTYEFVNKKNKDLKINANLRNNGDYGFACYSTSTGGAIYLYKKQSTPTLVTEISKFEELQSFRESVNRGDNYDGVEVKLTANLDMSEVSSTDNWQASIGTEAHPFKGIFNGQNHTISNLKNRSTQGSGEALPILTPNGLFGYIEGATIQDLSLTGLSIVNYGINTDVTSDETEVFTRGFGGLVGVADNSTIINCDVKGSVTYATSNNVGFVVGLMKGSSSVTGCDVDITTLNGHRATGGIVGGIQVDGNKTATITDCSTKGAGGGNAYTGGVAGYIYTAADGSKAIISKCFNKANFSGAYDYMGGVVGYVVSERVTIESCYNEGHIGGGLSKFIGGIAGYNKGVITNCYNTGAVAGSANIGGIIGLSESNTYSYVYCTGEITGDKVGGIIGAGRGSVYGHCYYLSTLADYGCASGTGATPDGRSLGDQISDEAMNFTKLSLSEMQGWKLSSDASDKLGEGKDLGTGFGESRKWIFVRANLPILTGVRGQTVQIVGAPGQHNASESSTYTYAYASFYSDMTFKCTTSFTGVYNEKYKGYSKSAFEVKFVQVPQGIMYGGVDSNGKKKGYILFQNYIVDDSEIDPKPIFTLDYLPNEVATSDAAMSLKDGNIFYGTHSYTLKDDMKVSDGNLYSLSVIDKVAAYRPYTGKYLGGNKSYIIYNYEEVAQSLGTEPTANPTANQVRPAAIRLSNLFVEPSKVLLGDVDVDGSVTISDVVKVVNAIISDVYDDDVMEYGDVNGDGELDVADVVGIVNTVLDIRYDDVKARKVSSAVNGGNEASLEQNDGLVDFLLNNSNTFCAFQFYMNAEDGLDCEKVTLSARAKGHSVSMNKLSDGRYKVMCYSGGNNTFTGNEGELFNILIGGASGKLTLENLFFVTPGASKVKFGNLDIDVVPTGINSIDADANANAIFDLSGRRVQQPQKGVYIVNGKKIMY